MGMIEEQDIIKYQKKKESSVSKASKKSKHKHIYNKRVILCSVFSNAKYLEGGIAGHKVITIVDYCSLCGKINRDNSLRWSQCMYEENGKTYFRFLTLEDAQKKYPEAELIYTTEHDMWCSDNIAKITKLSEEEFLKGE